MQESWDVLWTEVNIATMREGMGEYGVIEDGAIAVNEGRIAWVGRAEELSKTAIDSSWVVHSGGGRWLTPGLIDCHTHIIYGGNRAAEFERRLKGASYADLQAAGGGILSTVRATRAATEQELFASAKKRIRALKREGVTTLEIKSGYGLDAQSEIKMLRVARRLKRDDPSLDILTSFLGAHALPPEFSGNSSAYIDYLVDLVLPEVASQGLADAVDGFCEGIAFSPQEIKRLYVLARELGLPVKLHADQLSDLGGAGLAADFKALSADHLEFTSEANVKKMAASGTVAVLLPGAFYTLRETQLPPVKAFREHKVPMAIATDANPGSSPVLSLLLMLNMACTLFSLTPAEALAGVTRNAAKALGLGEDRGTLEVGKRADFALWDIESPAELAYMIGADPCVQVVKDGEIREPS